MINANIKIPQVVLINYDENTQEVLKKRKEKREDKTVGGKIDRNWLIKQRTDRTDSNSK